MLTTTESSNELTSRIK